MKNIKTLPLRMLAGMMALVLMGGILFVANSFVGNPISARVADKAIKQYVAENYSSLDLEIGKTIYNFKEGSYMARAASKTSMDTRFAIYYRNGKVQRDYYESYVVGMINTLDRLSEEYSTIAKGVLDKELGYENNTTIVRYAKDEIEYGNDILELDMEFDKAVPIDFEVTIRIDLKDTSLDEIARVLTDAHGAFVENQCNFYRYSLFAENDGILVMVSGVTPADIERGELTDLLEKAQKNDNINGISVFIKGEK